MPNDNLVFDLGAHRGVDCRFYLECGYKVVAVEANPRLAGELRTTFARQIADGRLIVENIGISHREGIQPFFSNLDVDEWSSFIEQLGTRRDARYEVVDVECRSPGYLFDKYGMPYFLKVDIEGYETTVVRELAARPNRPAFVSIEDGGLDYMHVLAQSGAKKYQFVSQNAIRDVPLRIARLGKSWTFGASSSGPFGPDLPGEWLDPETALRHYVDHVSKHSHDTWWDIHGMY